MKDSREIYEEIFNQNALLEIKILKNKWIENADKKDPSVVDSYFMQSSMEDSEYQYFQEEIKFIIEYALQNVIVKLIEKYDVEVDEYISVYWEDVRRQKTDCLKDCYYMEMGETAGILAYITHENNEKVLYIFKRFGFTQGVALELIKDLIQEKNIDKIKYVSFVKKNAFTEILDTTNPEEDENSANNIYSFKYYFEQHFGVDEYKCFEKYITQFIKDVEEYVGVAVVRTLKPNALFGFRNKVVETIRGLDYPEIISELQGKELTQNQKQSINEQFFGMKYYMAMVGERDFAKSFITAEWLYKSLGNPGYIDLTSIAMGYLKAAEQLLYRFVELNTYEKTNWRNTIDVGTIKMLDLTDSLLKEKKDFITLGNMTFFFGRNGNRRLLNNEKDTELFEIIKAILSKIKGLRNGYFHKDNLEGDDGWAIVEDIRNGTLAAFYLFLGAYDLSNIKDEELGINRKNEDDQFNKLCKHCNSCAMSDPGQEIPIFYLEDTDDKYDFYLAVPDPIVEYDANGNANYSAVYLKRIGPDGEGIKLLRDYLPEKISEGRLTIHVKETLEIEPTGPETTIFEAGKFLLGD